jgi:hypothetical protein
MRYNVTITVKPDGKMDISMLIAVMKTEYMGDTGAGLTEEQKQQFLEKGFEAEEYNKDNYYGFYLTKKDITPEEVAESVDNSQDSVQAGSMKGFKFTKEGLKYIIDWEMNSGSGEGSGTGEKTDVSTYANYFKAYNGYVTLTINLPVKPVKSNATTVSNNGKTLEWDLLAMGNNGSIHLEFMLINIWLIVLIVVAAIVVVGLIVLLIVLLRKRSKRIKVPVVHLQPVDDANSMSWGMSDADFGIPYGKTDAGSVSQQNAMGSEVQVQQSTPVTETAAPQSVTATEAAEPQSLSGQETVSAQDGQNL